MNAREDADPSRWIGVERDNDREEDDELFTPRQVAALFHVSPKTVARWAQTGKIGFITTVGGHRRYHRTEIRALLRALSDPEPACSDLDAVTGTR